MSASYNTQDAGASEGGHSEAQDINATISQNAGTETKFTDLRESPSQSRQDMANQAETDTGFPLPHLMNTDGSKAANHSDSRNVALDNQATADNGEGATSAHAAASATVSSAKEQEVPLETFEQSSESHIGTTESVTDDIKKLSLETKALSSPITSNAANTTRNTVRSPSPPVPPPKDDQYIAAVNSTKDKLQAKNATDSEYDEKHPPEDDSIADQKEKDDDSRSEIQSIMDQFEEGGQGVGVQEIMSPRLEKTQPAFFPPRSSSLEPTNSGQSAPSSPLQRMGSRESYTFNTSSVRPPSISGAASEIASVHSADTGKRESLISPSPSHTSIFQPPPPSPDPEPDLPFDFHRFLEQLRHRTADPVARFLRSFLMEFGKKQWMVHEQVKIISDFLEFISKKMSQCEVWRTVSDAEFDNAREGMEKLVMNRLYSQTFSPAIPPLEQTPAGRTKRARAQAAQDPHGPGRRGQHQEDVERDDVIAQKIRIYGWIREEHLDIPTIDDKGRKFLALAQKEFLKINSYRAPRDKVICVLNCCKVIFGFLKNNKSDQSADAFVPLLIYTVLRANPDHLASNIQYIVRFRNQDKLGGEAGYYISSLMGVVSFIENLDRTNLTITDAEFEQNVEAAVSAIAEGHKAESYESATHSTSSTAAPQPPPSSSQSQTQTAPHHLSEKSTLARPEVTPRNSLEAERATPRRNASQRLSEKQRTASTEDPTSAPNTSNNNNILDPSRSSGAQETGSENVATGLLRSIQKPLSTIGRIFSDEIVTQANPQLGPSNAAGQAPPSRRRSPVSQGGGGGSSRSRERRPEGPPRAGSGRSSREAERMEESAARQASVEAAEAARIRDREHAVVVETLQGMFPDLDKDVISDVVRMKEGRVGLAVDACLALSN